MGNCQKQQYEKNSGQFGALGSMKITNYSCSKEYEGLFNFSFKDVSQKSISTCSDNIVLKEGQNMMLLDSGLTKLSEREKKKCLFQIKRADTHYLIYPIFMENDMFMYQKPLWLVISSLPCNIYTVQEKDVLRLGKQKIYVRQIAHIDESIDLVPSFKSTHYGLSQNQPCVSQIDINDGCNSDLTHTQRTNQASNEPICRICLENGNKSNPLISPCYCSGSVKFMHLKCLRMWLGKKLKVDCKENYTLVKLCNFVCEMCQTPFSNEVVLDGKRYQTVEFPYPEKPYISVFVKGKNSTTKKRQLLFFLISFAKKSIITIGRGKESDLKLSKTKWISRVHARFEYDHKHKTINITDNKSKFGTSALIKNGIIANPLFPGITCQIGAQIYCFQPNSIPSSSHQNNNFEKIPVSQYLVKEPYLQPREEDDQSLSDPEMDDQDEEQEQVLPNDPTVILLPMENQ